jgi:NAD(P)H-hydrate epimerase
MRAADAHAIDTLGIPGRVLMETAGQRAARLIIERHGPVDGQSVAIACGKGNNGGDGLVVARVLLDHGAQVHVLARLSVADYSGDAGGNAGVLQRLADAYGPALRWTVVDTPEAVPDASELNPSVWVDALLGTGLSDAPREPLATLIRRMNAHAAPTVALDVPSGLNSDTGQAHPPTVQANTTVTFGAEKAGLRLGAGPECTGDVCTIRIGIPQHVLHEHARKSGSAYGTTDAYVQAQWPVRTRQSHKYNVGMALVVGGSAPYAGAPAMAARAAARSGAGYVACAVPASIQETVAGHSPAFPVHAWPNQLRNAAAGLQRPIEKAQALLIGPGLDPETAAPVVHSLLDAFDGPVVLDAGALHVVKERLLSDSNAPAPWVLTPHAGEFAALTGTKPSDIDDASRIHLTQTYAAEWGVTLLLKGYPSVVANPEGRTFVGLAGGPALATAGTGDALAGLIAGFAAQGLAPVDAAACAMHLGGRAAEHVATQQDARTLTPLDLIDACPHALDALPSLNE